MLGVDRRVLEPELESERAGMNEFWIFGRTAGLSFAPAESVLDVDSRALELEPEPEPESERVLVLSCKVC